MAGGSWQRRIERYVLNPGPRLALRLGIAPRAFALIETTGCRSGLARLTPIGIGIEGSTAWLVAEHGTGCSYVKNIQSEPRVRIKQRRTWHSGTATLVEDDDPMARRRRIDQSNGVIGRLDGVFFRTTCSTPCTIRIDLDQ
jgi:deazaflavin-dependent oxidoreductase (nitroreductase family)